MRESQQLATQYGTYDDNADLTHGFLLTGGTYTTLDDPLGTNATNAFGINNAGQIVGFYSSLNGPDHGFLYRGGTYTTLDDPLATQFTRAFGINDAGLIVGHYFEQHRGTRLPLQS